MYTYLNTLLNIILIRILLDNIYLKKIAALQHSILARNLCEI